MLLRLSVLVIVGYPARLGGRLLADCVGSRGGADAVTGRTVGALPTVGDDR